MAHAQLSEEFESDPILGDPIANYPSDRTRLLIQGGVIFLLIGGVLNIAFLPVEAATASIIVISSMAVVTLLIAWYVLHLWNREVVLYERGLSYRRGSQTALRRYDEVQSIHVKAERMTYFFGLVRRKVYRCTITTALDEALVLDNIYRRIDDLVLRLEREVNRVLRQKAETQLANGYEVPFGSAVTLASGGLTVNGNALPWARFAGYSISSGQLTFNASDQPAWAQIALDDIENVTLLLSFLKTHQRAS